MDTTTASILVLQEVNRREGWSPGTGGGRIAGFGFPPRIVIGMGGGGSRGRTKFASLGGGCGGSGGRAKFPSLSGGGGGSGGTLTRYRQWSSSCRSVVSLGRGGGGGASVCGAGGRAKSSLRSVAAAVAAAARRVVASLRMVECGGCGDDSFTGPLSGRWGQRGIMGVRRVTGFTERRWGGRPHHK